MDTTAVMGSTITGNRGGLASYGNTHGWWSYLLAPLENGQGTAASNPSSILHAYYTFQETLPFPQSYNPNQRLIKWVFLNFCNL